MHHYPRRYIDRSRVLAIGSLPLDAYVTVIARCVGSQSGRRAGVSRWWWSRSPTAPAPRPDASTSHGSRPGTGGRGAGGLRHRPAVSRPSAAGEPGGQVPRSGDQDLAHTGRITPVHPAADGVTPRTIRELLWRAFEQLPPRGSAPARESETPRRWTSATARCRWIHFPADDGELRAARERLKFDELFTLELGVGFRKTACRRANRGAALEPTGPLIEALRCRSRRPHPAPRHGRDRRADGDAAHERPAPGRRRRRQDSWRCTRVSSRSIGTRGGDDGADRGARRTASALDRGAARRHRRGAVPRDSRERECRGPVVAVR